MRGKGGKCTDPSAFTVFIHSFSFIFRLAQLQFQDRNFVVRLACVGLKSILYGVSRKLQGARRLVSCRLLCGPRVLHGKYFPQKRPSENPVVKDFSQNTLSFQIPPSTIPLKGFWGGTTLYYPLDIGLSPI